MSRIGKKTIIIPEKVTVAVKNHTIVVKGPKGELAQELKSSISVEQKDNKLLVSVKDPQEKTNRALWGLFRVLIANMISGVTQGFEKKLEVNGVGFKIELKGKRLILNLGFSHPIEFELPSGVEAKVEKNIITISGIDKQLVGDTAARIRSIKKPEPYKGKGIKYLEETIRRKAGKVVKGAEGTQ